MLSIPSVLSLSATSPSPSPRDTERQKENLKADDLAR
jgi:hypothetical protein